MSILLSTNPSTTESITPASSIPNTMADKMLHEYSIPIVANVPVGPAINMGDVNFKLKTGLIMMVQANPFCGLPSDDANTHLQHFLELCDTIVMEGVTLEIIRLHLFPFSLMGGQNSGSTRTRKLSTHETSIPRYSS
jgi:hypothetical protein